MRLCTTFLAFLLFWCDDAYPQDDGYKLELLQVLFRHGDRVCTTAEIYKNDPYDAIHRKHGYGELTRAGFQREYKIGRMLRERYDGFLGDYHFDDVYGYSTNVRRTKTSLLLVLAGLYPSTEKTAWNDELKWIPIPISYSKDPTNFLSSFLCPQFIEMQKEVINGPEFTARFDEFREFNKYLSTEIGSNMEFKNYLSLLLYNNIRATTSMGLPMPAWCDETCYLNLRKMTRIVFDSLVGNSTMARFIVGPTIERMIENIYENEYEDSKQKIYLYSAHDFNVATFEEVHNFTGLPVTPDFGSAIMVEKLKDAKGEIYIRMLLWTGAEEQLIPLKIRDCADPCPLRTYERLVHPIRFRGEYSCSTVSRGLAGLKIASDAGGVLRHKGSLGVRRRRKFNVDEQLAALYAGRDLLEFKYGRQCLDNLNYQ